MISIFVEIDTPSDLILKENFRHKDENNPGTEINITKRSVQRNWCVTRKVKQGSQTSAQRKNNDIHCRIYGKSYVGSKHTIHTFRIV